jgi:hypothetical protein
MAMDSDFRDSGEPVDRIPQVPAPKLDPLEKLSACLILVVTALDLGANLARVQVANDEIQFVANWNKFSTAQVLSR